MNAIRVSLIGAASLIVASCATNTTGPSPFTWVSQSNEIAASEDNSTVDQLVELQNETVSTSDALTPDIQRSRVGSLRNSARAETRSAQDRPVFTSGLVNATLPPQPLPAFINTVFGDILDQPFTLGPGVAEREEMISLRSVRDLTQDSFLVLVEQALKDYGLGVSYNQGLFSIIELADLRAQMPQFIRARTQPSVPAGLRPIVQYVELNAIDSADMASILEQAFPDSDVLRVQANRRVNTLTLSGLADDVNAALVLIDEMDELRFAGAQLITVSLNHWTPSELASTLNEILTLEGYMVGVGISAPRTLTLLPLDYTNQVMIFASTRQLADRALSLAVQLDQEAFDAEVRSPYVYQVENTEASLLAEIVSGVISARGMLSDTRAQSNENNNEEANTTSFGNLTVDELGNRIVFYGTQSEYSEFLRLAQSLDTPVPEVMIEVTIAEVTLTDDSSYGLDIVFNSNRSPRFNADLRRQGSFRGVIATGEVTLTATANSNNNQINVLSTPRIIARSGTEASVQVGSDVPIITSQSAANSQSGGSSDILQTVQYRSTGVILSVEPRVYSDNRIDLVINQETSAAEANETSGITSPTITTRSMSSSLSLQDGQTAVLGGLIENRFTRRNGGIPLVKDLPVVGVPFRNEGLQATRTMLVVLVTPYVLNSRQDRQQVVDAFVNTLNTSYQNQLRANGTLLPPTEPMQIRPAGSFLNETEPAAP